MLLGLLLCAGCAGQASPGPDVAPSSPTIAAPPIRVTSHAGSPVASRPSATPPNAASRPSAAPPAATQIPDPAGDQSVYFWPSYLPADMRPSPTESRVARDDEVGQNGLGFYIVTLNAGGQKLVVGGGDLQAALPLVGSQQSVVVGNRTARLVTSGEQRQVIFDMPKGLLFVYSVGLSEQELLRVAESLQPINVSDLRARAGVS
jgi:hypothetical protein